ncbi:MAG: hypothetical protein COV75_03475 [Candidatus Omnitrophica bacterium CG11_big_fil_rev_8_21_14_0_20_63_9]|nr:MAG: hypothetical protein COV75_03475 [Candidatus Omnitrophica bacterium CG11_big_fil_rev_8_21_14_0_20_63_9]
MLMMRLRSCLLLCGLLASTGASSLGGCAPANREQLTKEALAADPEFKAVLEKRRQLANRVETYEKELTLSRSIIEQKIAQLKQDLAAATTRARMKIIEVKRQMDPDRERLTVALTLASEELKMKRGQRAVLGRQMAQLRKTSKAPSLTSEDRARYEQQLTGIQKDAGRVDQELAALKQHVRLLKIKLLLIKL